MSEQDQKRVATRPAKKSGVEPGQVGSGQRVKWNERNTISVKNRDPNYEYRVVNTDADKYQGRIESLQARGYTICNGDEQMGDERGTEASQVGSVIGKPVGNGTRGVLMRIPKEFYKEDQAIKQAEIDRVEEGMVPEELRGSDMVGEGLKIQDAQGTHMEVTRRQ